MTFSPAGRTNSIAVSVQSFRSFSLGVFLYHRQFALATAAWFRYVPNSRDYSTDRCDALGSRANPALSEYSLHVQARCLRRRIRVRAGVLLDDEPAIVADSLECGNNVLEANHAGASSTPS